jgi:hypothetical protein
MKRFAAENATKIKAPKALRAYQSLESFYCAAASSIRMVAARPPATRFP